MANQLKVYQILRLQKKLRENNVDDVFNYVPFFEDDELTHILATKKETSFYKIEDLENAYSVNYSNLDEKDETKTTVRFVYGYLYDYKNDVFVSAPLSQVSYGRTEYGAVKEYLFCLYDNGVPNLIYDKTKSCYFVITQYGKGMYTFIECSQSPTIYSHLSKDGSLKRVVFTCHPNWNSSGFISNLLLVLTKTNSVLHITNKIISVDSIYQKDKIESNKEYLKVLYDDVSKVDKFKAKMDLDICELPEIEYLYDTDFLMIKSYNGKYGDYVFFCPAFMDKVDFEYSVYAYKVDDVQKSEERSIKLFANLDINDFEMEDAQIKVARDEIYCNKIQVSEFSYNMCEERAQM